MTKKQAIEEASARFYDALNRTCSGDPEPMKDAWWHDETVTVGHPMGNWLVGWETVWLTWVEFSKVLEKPNIVVTGLAIHFVGDVAYTTGTENVVVTLGGSELRWSSQVTNIFREKDGEWRLVHHHADKAPTFEAAI